MPELGFRVETVEPLVHSIVPGLNFHLHITNTPADERIFSGLLRCQFQIEPGRRTYTSEEQRRLYELFDRPERWGQTVRPLAWTNTTAVIPAFQQMVALDLAIPCSFEFNIAATKYFHALADGEVPLCLLFSGTAFYESRNGALQVAPISWDKEARFRLPVKVWQEMMDLYYPETAWLCLRRDVFERLYEYKMGQGTATWEEALEKMLAASNGSGKALPS